MVDLSARIDPDVEALLPVAPTMGRLIRLGPRQRWAKRAIATSTLRFGFLSEPHDLCFESDWDAVKISLIRSGKVSRTAAGLTNQMRDFYTLGADTLWVARVERCLWWGFAEPDVIDLRGSGDEMGVVARRIRGGWRKHDIKGDELLVDELGPDFKVLKSVPAICKLEKLAAFCHLINDQ